MAQTDFFHRLIQWPRANASLLALASCTLAMNLLMTLFNFYYVKVFLQTYHITSAWLSSAQLVYMICNFATRPFIAYALDYRPVILRNRRRLVMVAGPIMSLVFMITWIPWYSIDDTSDRANWLPGVHLIVVLVLWNIFYSVVSSCSCGLFAEMSTDETVRVKVLTCNQIANLIGASVIFPVDALSKSVMEFRTFQICCGVVAAIALCCFVFTGFKASDVVAQTGGSRVQQKQRKEKDSFDLDVKPQESCPFTNLRQYFIIVYQVVRTRNFWCAVIANFMTFFRLIVIHNFFAVFTEGLISPDLLPTGSVIIAAFYLVSQVAPNAIFILAAPLIAYIGSKRILQASLVLAWLNSAIALFLGVWVGYNSMIGFLLVESVLVAFQGLFVICYSEVIDQDVKRHNRKIPATTIIFTMTGLVIQPSASLAPIIVLRALNIGDYDQYKGDIRSAPVYTQQIMFLVATCTPAASALVSFLCMWFYKSEKAEKKVVTRL